MIKLNKNLIIFVSILFALIYILCFYLNLSYQDSYFPYWDSYDLKNQSESIDRTYFSSFADPLVFYNLKIFKEISGISYYWIIKYSSFFHISLLFFSIILFLKSMFFKKDANYSYFIVGSTYFFFLFYSVLRFSMTLRENLVIPVGLFFSFIILTKNNQKIFSLPLIFIIPLFLSYLLGAHILTFLIFGGLCFLYLFYLLFKKELSYKNLLVIIIPFLIITTPFIYKESYGFFNQFVNGEDLIRQTGFESSYNDIKTNYFFIKFDLIILPLGLFFLLKNNNKIKKTHKVPILIYSFIIFCGLVGTYIRTIGVKQNRFTLYSYLILSLLLTFSLYHLKNKKLVLSLFITTIIILSPLQIINSYQTYKPINEQNINYLLNNSDLLQNYEFCYCGKSARSVLSFFDVPVNCIFFEEIIPSLNGKLEKPIVLLKDDLSIYEIRLTDYLIKINTYRYSNNEIFDKETGTLIILPS